VGLVAAFLFLGCLLYFNPALLSGDAGASVHSRGLKDSSLEAHLRYPFQQVRAPPTQVCLPALLCVCVCRG
jgi:hypothetical protein